MPTVRGVPLKRPAFEGEGWKGAATDAKQMRLTPVTGLNLEKGVFSPTWRGYILGKTQNPDLTVPYNRDCVP